MSIRSLVQLRLITTIVLIATLVGTGLAHTKHETPLSPDLIAFVASGGSLADICGDFDGQTDSQGQNCEACRIGGTMILPPNCAGVSLVSSDAIRSMLFVAKRIHRTRPIDSTRLTRAPPQA